MVLQSLPVNAWLLWRFALQSHQFWLSTESQKEKQNYSKQFQVNYLQARQLPSIMHSVKNFNILRKTEEASIPWKAKIYFSFTVKSKSHAVVHFYSHSAIKIHFALNFVLAEHCQMQKYSVLTLPTKKKGNIWKTLLATIMSSTVLFPQWMFSLKSITLENKTWVPEEGCKHKT